MKKILDLSPVMICVLTVFLPLCQIIGLAAGYEFALCSYSGAIVVLAAVSIAIALLLFLKKAQLEEAGRVCSALLFPLSAINGICFVFLSGWEFTFIFILICCGCSAAVFVKYAHPPALKITSLVLAVLLLFLFLFLSLAVFFFRGFGGNAIVKSVNSPQNTYAAEVIDGDQGALGGYTFVNVRNRSKTIDVLIGRFTKAPVRIYAGAWDEFKNMQLYWIDDHTLVIDGREYDVRDEF